MEKQGILVYLECADGHIVKVSLEAMNAAQKLAAMTGKKIGAVLVNSASAAAEAAANGADFVLAVNAGDYNAEAYAAMLAQLMADYEPAYMLVGSTRDGKDIAARAAAAQGAGLITDAFDLNEEGWVRSIYGGSLMATMKAEGPVVVTGRSGSFGKPELKEGASAPVETVEAPIIKIRATVREAVKELGEAVNLEDAEVIVAGGRGLGSAENFKLVEELAEVLGGVVGASRPAIEDGWVSRDHQVGQSGKIVAPKLYIAVGISGAIQHVSGMSGSGYIVAINKDEDAPIFEVADCGIVANCLDVLPLMIEEIKKRKA